MGCFNLTTKLLPLRRIYDSLYGALEHSSIPAAVLIIAKYQYQIAFVADQEINLQALTEIMVGGQFKMNLQDKINSAKTRILELESLIEHWEKEKSRQEEKNKVE